MTTCNCAKYDHLLDNDSLDKRFKETKKIVAGLESIAKDSTGEHHLLHCTTCGQNWQRSLSWMDGNKEYVFKVVDIDTAQWTKKPFVQPDDLFVRSGSVNMFLSRATFEEQNEKCRRDDCNNQAVKMSPFCLVHHMESIGIKASLPDSNTWFSPYERENFELTIERLKELPTYKSLNDSKTSPNSTSPKAGHSWWKRLFGS